MERWRFGAWTSAVSGRGTTADASPAAQLFASRLRGWLARAWVPLPSLALATADTPAQQRAASRFASTGVAATLRRSSADARGQDVTVCFEKGRGGSIEWVPWYDA